MSYPQASRAGVTATVDIQYALQADLGIALGGAERLMPEEFLNRPEVRAPLQQVGCEGVAEAMGRDRS